MKFQITVTSVIIASMLAYLSMADDFSTMGHENETMAFHHNSTTTNMTHPESKNITMPVIVIVEQDDNQHASEEKDEDYAARSLKWLIVKKITNISIVKETSTDPKTGKTTGVMHEDRAEEFRVFRDDQQRQILTEKDMKSMPFPMRFL